MSRKFVPDSGSRGRAAVVDGNRPDRSGGGPNGPWRAGRAVVGPAFVALLLAAAIGVAEATDVAVILTGDQEVPSVSTAAKGTGKIVVGEDKSVSGTIRTTGITGTMAHIHEGGPGKNGPPIIPLTKGDDGTWSVPPGSKLTDAQYQAFKAGRLYINVHTDEHKGGEIRAQLKP